MSRLWLKLKGPVLIPSLMHIPRQPCIYVFKAHFLDHAYIDASDMENRKSGPCSCTWGPNLNTTFPHWDFVPAGFLPGRLLLPLHPARLQLAAQVCPHLPSDRGRPAPCLHLVSPHPSSNVQSFEQLYNPQQAGVPGNRIRACAFGSPYQLLPSTRQGPHLHIRLGSPGK